jgi:hypothetical protein
VDEFVEPAHFAVRRAVPVEERQVCSIELFKEIIPGDLFELFVLGFEIEPQDPDFVVRRCTLDGRRMTAGSFRPLADEFMICGDVPL